MSIQGFYRRNKQYIVVRRISLTATESLSVGTELPNADITLRGFHMRSLFQRGYIGLKGSAWTAARLPNEPEALEVEPKKQPKPKKAKAKKDPAEPVKKASPKSWEK